MADQITTFDYEVSSQFAHFMSAAFLVTEAGRFGLKGLIASSLGMLAFAAVKEFWYDIRHENVLVRGSSTLDFVMYAAGIITAIGLWFV
jgi:hypothetical protein